MYPQIHPNHKMHIHEANIRQELNGSAARHEVREARRMEAREAAQERRASRQRRRWTLQRLAATITTATGR